MNENQNEYKWVVQQFYKNDVEAPKLPGAFVDETFCENDARMRAVVELAERQGDVNVSVISIRDYPRIKNEQKKRGLYNS